MDLLLNSAYPGHQIGCFVSGRCPHCGQGLISNSDGFVRIRCDQCGRYVTYGNPCRNLGLSSLKNNLKLRLSRIYAVISSPIKKRQAHCLDVAERDS